MPNWIYEKLFESARGRLAKILISAVIGGLVGFGAMVKTDDAKIRDNWHWGLAGGMACGALAAVLLTASDRSNEERAAAGRPPRSTGSQIVWVVSILIGLCFLALVGGLVWTVVSLR